MEKLKAVQKRDLLVKEVLSPLLKEAGFYKKRMNWWKELEDGYPFISTQNSCYSEMDAKPFIEKSLKMEEQV